MDRFVRALHRRFILLRGAERVGLCLLIASGGGALLLPIAWWQGIAAVPVVLFALAAGLLIGLIAAVLHRPSRMDAAIEADRQLWLADLLSTALTIRPDNTPWAATVLAIADARCRRLSPSSVLLRRWGGRAWGGVGLATTLVLTLALLSTRSSPSQAAVDVTDPFASPDRQSPTVRQTSSTAYAGHRRPSVRPPTEPQDDESSQSGTVESPADRGAENAANPASPGTSGTNAGDPTGTGPHSAMTAAPHSSVPPPANAARGSSQLGQGPSASGGQAVTAPGDSQANAHPAAGASAGANSAAAKVPAWKSTAWPQDQQSALDHVSSRPQYDPYRDLIRAYFERE